MIACYTNCVSPHQLPLAQEIVKRVGSENFRYVYRDGRSQEQTVIWCGNGDLPEWCKRGDENTPELLAADVLYCGGLRPFSLFEKRLKNGKKTLYMTERWFKPPIGMLRLLHPRYFRYARRLANMMDNPDFMVLPIGIHAARDIARLCGLMHGDLRCLFRAPELEFERKPGGKIFSHVEHVERVGKCCLDKMRLWGYFVENGERGTGNGCDGFRSCAQEKVDEWLVGVSEHRFVSELDKLLDEKLKTGEYKFRGNDGRVAMREGAIRFFRQFSQKIVELSDGRCVYFTPDERAKIRNADNAVSWAEYAIHAVTSSGKMLEGKEYRERLYNPRKANVLEKIESIIKDEHCMYRLIDAHPENDAVLFIGYDGEGARLEVVTRLDSFGNADANLAEVTVVAMHKKRQTKESSPPPKNYRPLTEVVETVAKHQAAGFSPSTTNGSIAYPAGECKGAIKVLWVGRLLKLKRVDTIIRAVGEISHARSASKRLTTNDYQLTTTLDIYGTGPEENRLKKLASKYGDVIKFHPPVPISEVRKLMREHDVFVFASNGYEGWGAVVSEALEEGLKVIGTCEAGASATMLPKERLFRSGDYVALAALLKKECNGELPPCTIGDWTAAKTAEVLGND